jgi:hypothetical protein
VLLRRRSILGLQSHSRPFEWWRPDKRPHSEVERIYPAKNYVEHCPVTKSEVRTFLVDWRVDAQNVLSTAQIEWVIEPEQFLAKPIAALPLH